MANDRVYYAIQQVSFGKDSLGSSGARVAAHGVQSIGITTTFNLEQVFELGQLAIYENVEGTPDVEVTMSKVLDGYIPLFCLATADQTDGPALSQRSNSKCFVQMGIWDEGKESAGQADSNAGSWCEMSGLVVSSVGYNFPLDDNFSEDITLVGNFKVWGSGTAQNSASIDCGVTYYPDRKSGEFGGNNDAPIGDGGVNRRENIQFAKTTAATKSGDYTIVPEDIPGVGQSGQKGTAHVSSISVSTDLSREDIFELGAKLPYAKKVTFPVEVTCDIEVTTASGDMINALDDCSGEGDAACNTKTNLDERRIRISTCEGLRIWLGQKNKLSSVSYGGGDAGGGNATVTYSYSTFNDCTVMHMRDVSGSGGSTSSDGWWTARETYIGTGVYY